jgi:hypothetical protein
MLHLREKWVKIVYIHTKVVLCKNINMGKTYKGSEPKRWLFRRFLCCNRRQHTFILLWISISLIRNCVYFLNPKVCKNNNFILNVNYCSLDIKKAFDTVLIYILSAVLSMADQKSKFE